MKTSLSFQVQLEGKLLPPGGMLPVHRLGPGDGRVGRLGDLHHLAGLWQPGGVQGGGGRSAETRPDLALLGLQARGDERLRGVRRALRHEARGQASGGGLLLVGHGDGGGEVQCRRLHQQVVSQHPVPELQPRGPDAPRLLRLLPGLL